MLMLMPACTYVHVYVYACKYACMHACMNVWMDGCMDAYLCGCPYVEIDIDIAGVIDVIDMLGHSRLSFARRPAATTAALRAARARPDGASTLRSRAPKLAAALLCLARSHEAAWHRYQHLTNMFQRTALPQHKTTWRLPENARL